MGKTKTAVVSGGDNKGLSGKEKYKLKQQRKAQEEAKNKKVRVAGLGGGQRVVAIGGDNLPTADNAKVEEKETKIQKVRKVKSKKYKKSASNVDKSKLYSLLEAIKLVQSTSYSKFDGSVEIHAVLKKEGVSVSVTLAHPTGKAKKIEVANEKTVEKLKTGKVDFDVLLATADMMPKLVPFAKLLGPKGLMPNPKNGTLIKDKKDAKKFSGNSMTVKTERKAPLVHCVVGKVSQKSKELQDNVEAIVNTIGKNQVVKLYLTSTMGPSVKVSL